MVSETLTVRVAVPARSRTVTLSVPLNGARSTVSTPPMSAEPGEAIEEPRPGQQALDLDRLVGLLAGPAQRVGAGAALDAVVAVQRAA